MITFLRNIKDGFYKLPDSLISVMLIGCESCILLLAVSIMFRLTTMHNLDGVALADILASYAVRLMAATTLVSIAMMLSAALQKGGK